MTPGRFRYQGYALGYEVHGEGERVIVLTNGLLLDAGVNRQLARALAAHGFRVVLLDLLGHGTSDKPHHATQHRMDRYARQVVALLDELHVQRAVVGGVSLGANVSLHVAVQAPDRVAALLVEMPLLEWATPAAASVFVPLLFAVTFARRLFGFATSLLRRLPRTGIDPLDSFLGTFSMEPEAIAAVLHGILVGPVAPEIEERCAIVAPTLIIGHENDLIHPFSDAENLAQQVPGARLVHARSMFELRLSPERLTREIVRFLDEVFGVQEPARLVADGESVGHQDGAIQMWLNHPMEEPVGDKSPRSKERDQKQKNAAKAESAAEARSKQDRQNRATQIPGKAKR